MHLSSFVQPLWLESHGGIRSCPADKSWSCSLHFCCIIQGNSVTLQIRACPRAPGHAMHRVWRRDDYQTAPSLVQSGQVKSASSSWLHYQSRHVVDSVDCLRCWQKGREMSWTCLELGFRSYVCAAKAREAGCRCWDVQFYSAWNF